MINAGVPLPVVQRYLGHYAGDRVKGDTEDGRCSLAGVRDSAIDARRGSPPKGCRG
jgi:hypothetical protein